MSLVYEPVVTLVEVSDPAQRVTVVQSERVIVETGIPGPPGERPLRFAFAESLEWVVTHNRNTLCFIERLRDAEGNSFWAPVQILDANRFRVQLGEATAGTVDVIFG